jgi:hypothetical protein
VQVSRENRPAWRALRSAPWGERGGTFRSRGSLMGSAVRLVGRTGTDRPRTHESGVSNDPRPSPLWSSSRPT